MDEIMYGKLKAEEHKRIVFTLTSLKPLEGAAATPAQYEATGRLSVAGVTNTITMPVSITQAQDGRIRVAGSVGTKMTDFGIPPPSPSLPGVTIKTGDEVTLKFEWWVKPTQRASAAK
jgi:polyisoprenoid-binding protein YceI